MKLVICGEGGLGHEILDMVLQIQKAGLKTYEEILFLDDNLTKKGYMSYKTMFSGDIYNSYDRKDTRFVLAIGEPLIRIKMIREITEQGYMFETLIHPSAYLGLNTTVGSGTVVQRDVFLSCDCKIGENCLLQPSLNVGHDSQIGNNCVLSTNVAISGDVHVGNDTYIAVGASVIQGAHIGSNSVVGMGSVVIRDIPDNVIAMGNPARPMRNKEESRVFK